MILKLCQLGAYRCNTGIVKKYTPLIPLTDKYNLVYANKHYMNALVLKPISFFTASIPAALMFINNYLVGWGWTNGTLFAMFFIAGIFFREYSSSQTANYVMSLEVSPDLEKFYLVIPQSSIAMNVLKFFPPHDQQLAMGKMDFYCPVENKTFTTKQEEDEITKEQDGSKALFLYRKSMRATFKRLKFEKEIIRLQIPRSYILRVFFEQSEEEEKEMQLNKQRSSIQQLMRKYENKTIVIHTGLMTKSNLSEEKPFSFIVKMEENGNRKFHDYLVAMALGYEVVPMRASKASKQKEAES